VLLLKIGSIRSYRPEATVDVVDARVMNRSAAMPREGAATEIVSSGRAIMALTMIFNMGRNMPQAPSPGNRLSRTILH